MKKVFAVISAVVISLIALNSCCNQQKEVKAKYIFLLIGDGMGSTHISAAESYLSYKAGKFGGKQLLMTTFPYYGTATAHSANYNISCSGAAGTAIACGEKANNGTIGINKDSVITKSIAYCLHEEGYNIGIISSVPVNHATPASFFAHETSRGNYYSIASQIPATNFEFFACGGFLDHKDMNGDKEPIDQVIEAQGYTVCYGLEEFQSKAAGKEKVILCQERNRDGNADEYVIETKADGDIPLAQMLELGIESLGDNEPFFFMCEGGIIDWVAHDHRTMAMITEVIDFDAAIKVAYDFYLQHPEETLIIVTADHETGGIALGCGPKSINWEKLENQWIESGKKNTLDEEENRALNTECNIGWTSYSHTGGAVPVFAIGKGAEKFNGRMDNTDIKGKILGE